MSGPLQYFRVSENKRINSETEAVSSPPWSASNFGTPDVWNLYLSCRDLPKLDRLSPSDPFCVLYVKSGDQWQEVGRTEVVWNDPNPEFVTFFQMRKSDANLRDPIRIEVYDADCDNPDLKKHDYVGRVESNLTDFRSECIQEGKATGIVRGTFVRAEISPLVFTAQVGFKGLPQSGFFSKTEVFFTLYACESGHDPALPVYRSEVVASSGGGTWKPFALPYAALNKDLEQPLRVSLFKYQKNKPPELLGQTVASIVQFVSRRDKDFPLVGAGGSEVGSVTFSAHWELSPAADGLVASGLRFNVLTAVDLSEWPGSGVDADSPHREPAKPSPMSEYRWLLKLIVNAIGFLPSNGAYAGLGFGAVVAGDDAPNYCFPLNPPLPVVSNAWAINDLYRAGLQRAKGAEPRLIVPLIKEAEQRARAALERGEYTVLVIASSFLIGDWDAAVDAIVEAADAPLSVIFTSVLSPGSPSEAKFAEKFPSGKPLQSSKGKTAERNIVSWTARVHWEDDFVRFYHEVLRDLPQQVEQFYAAHPFQKAT